MDKISTFDFENLLKSAADKIYKANKSDLEALREKLEAIYIVDVNEFGMDTQRAVVECCLETYNHCAEMTLDTLTSFLRELIPWLEGHSEVAASEKVSQLLDSSEKH